MDLWIFLILFTGGCISGLLAGLLGFGGGMLFMLIFANYLSAIEIPELLMPQLILANSMFAMFIGGISGSVKHYSNNNFHLLPILITGATASICAILVTHFIIHSGWYNKDVFIVIFILIVGSIAYKILFIPKEAIGKDDKEGSSVKKLLLIGSVGGSLSALAGVGGGIAMVPMLTKMLCIDIRKATAISLGTITFISFSTTIYAFIVSPPVPVLIPYSYGLIVLPMVLPVAAGCFIFSPAGVSMAKKLSAGTIKWLYVVFLVIAILNMLYTMLSLKWLNALDKALSW